MLSASYLLRTRSVPESYLVRSFSPPIEAKKKRIGYEGEEKENKMRTESFDIYQAL